MRSLYSEVKIGGEKFLLAEKLDDYVSAQVAAAEYRAEGLCCRVEPVETKRETTYYIWTGRERKVKVRTLSHEKVRRRKGKVPHMRRSA